jgi:DNA-directed RNA polymerase subunit H (RpoH/RPB5)
MLLSRGLQQATTQSAIEALYQTQHGRSLSSSLPQVKLIASHFENVSVHGIWTGPKANYHIIYVLHTPPTGIDDNIGLSSRATSSMHTEKSRTTCAGGNSQSMLRCAYAQQKGKLTERIYADLLTVFQAVAQECIDLLAPQQPSRNLEQKINTVIIITNLQVSKMKSSYAPHEIIHASHLLFNREKMLLHSHLKKQTAPETRQFMRAYNTTPEHLPKLLSSDPYIQYLGLQQYTGVVTTTDNIRVAGQLQGLRSIIRGNMHQGTSVLAHFTKMKDAKCSKTEKLEYQAGAWEKSQTSFTPLHSTVNDDCCF